MIFKAHSRFYNAFRFPAETGKIMRASFHGVNMSLCPCGSGADYKTCCESIIAGKRPAATAEALLRARYSAFDRVDIKFIAASHASNTRGQLDLEGIEQWAREAEWKRLEIIRIERGQAGDTAGEIEFKAHYRLHNKDCVLHEVAGFMHKQGQWWYVDSRLPNAKQYVREAPKLGRNDPCSCGSGKKYKKCCAAA
jgi:SEC-C motif domain protein